MCVRSSGLVPGGGVCGGEGGGVCLGAAGID